MVDQVKVVADDQAPAEQSLRRNLTNRHIQLIAIGGAIGTGLFMGSGKTISLAGPSIIFVYMIIGFMLFFVMRAMGELLLSNLEYKSLVTSLPIYSGRGQDISPAGLTGSAGL
ncbi:D-serine/D-alanine/glycine transporter [Escherichia coli]|uniref:D-serine/D-alanine/glycine transporter n=1 Tax=Escherichia coli TaxID=562 RepID=A0A376VR51_ECOLX|nr:D-serine/D-alanine/glycine transporter [Escherichia coli]